MRYGIRNYGATSRLRLITRHLALSITYSGMLRIISMFPIPRCAVASWFRGVRTYMKLYNADGVLELYFQNFCIHMVQKIYIWLFPLFWWTRYDFISRRYPHTTGSIRQSALFVSRVKQKILLFWCNYQHHPSMMTSSNGNIFRVTGHLCGEFTGQRWIPAQRPVTRCFAVFFDFRLNKRLNKQS